MSRGLGDVYKRQGGGSSLVPAGGTLALSTDPASVTISNDGPATATPTPTDTPPPTATSTPTNTPTPTATNTPTSTPTDTPTSTPTNTPTATPTDTPTSTPTSTPTPTPTNTPTNTPTPTPAERLAALGTAVQGVGPGTSLADKVAAAQAALAAGDQAGACGALGDFLNLVRAQTGKSIRPAQAVALTATATGIRTQLGCG